MSTINQPLSQALTIKKSNLGAALLLAAGLIIALGAAAYGYLESRRTEKVVIAVRDIAYGHQIVADDLGTIELPLHRPVQLAGMTDPNLVVGTWAARTIGPNDLMQPAMLLLEAPDQPVYPSGQKLDKDTVPIPFSTMTIGPLTERDFVNVGFSDPNGDPKLCLSAGGEAVTAVPAPAAGPTTDAASDQGRPYACRLLQRVKVLWVDAEKSIAYLQVTPYQAHAIWSLQAANMMLWGERYGSTSDELPSLDRLDASQIDMTRLTMSISDTLKLYSPEGFGGAIPGGDSIPGQTTSAAEPVK
jgi:hypothetical protein